MEKGRKRRRGREREGGRGMKREVERKCIHRDGARMVRDGGREQGMYRGTERKGGERMREK